MADGEDTELAGREAVRVHFVNRLRTSGLIPRRGMTAAQQDEVLARLVDFLAYLSVPSLITLADEVLQAAGGKARNEWPSEVSIRSMAEGKQRRPFERAPIVTSWLASVEGPLAEARGDLAQLYRWLRVHRRPVMAYDLREVARQRDEDARRLHQMEQWPHMVTDADRRWAEALAADLQAAQQIVDRGRAARAAKLGDAA